MIPPAIGGAEGSYTTYTWTLTQPIRVPRNALCVTHSNKPRICSAKRKVCHVLRKDATQALKTVFLPRHAVVT